MSSMLSARGSRSSGNAVTPSVGDQCERREVTSTRQPPLVGRHVSSSPSSSQLSNTGTRERDLVGGGAAEPDHTSHKEAAIPMHELDSELSLAQAAESGGRDDLA